MKIFDLRKGLDIILSNEEAQVFEKIQSSSDIKQFTSRERVVLKSLLRKDMISSVKHENTRHIVKNENRRSITDTKY